jgi:hypothetical protein
MPYCHFLLTYSVQSQSSSRRDIEKAEQVRRDIAEIDIWEKMPDVETTFRGEVYINYLVDSDLERTELATAHVASVLEPLLEDAQATEDDVVIHCVMMVTGIGEAFAFRIAR